MVSQDFRIVATLAAVEEARVNSSASAMTPAWVRSADAPHAER
ncbi:hypothetical protein [Embleya sp. NPDC059237]